MERADIDDELADSYETAIQLLKLVQLDYRRAIQQLREMSSYLGQREAAASRQLRSAMEALERISAERNGAENGSHELPNGRSKRKRAPAAPASESVPMLEVYCLGKFQVRVGRVRIEQWHSVKAKALLKYLIAHRDHPVSKDMLMEALWPGCEPLLANNNLKAAARALRQTLSSVPSSNGHVSWILFQDGNYMINAEADLWADVDEFEYHWQVARVLEKEGSTAEAILEHRNAEQLYKGDYMEDNLYDEWSTLRREALKDTYLSILGRLADYSMQEADYEGCAVYCQKILGKDPCREDAYQRLMSCHSRLGQRSRAISWYRLCEKTIKAELGVAPNRGTAALHEKLLGDEYV